MLETELASATALEVAPSAPQEVTQPPPPTLTEMVTSQLLTLRAYHRAVLEIDSVEAIHKTRVTTRKLQASVDLLQTGRLAAGSKRVKRELRTWRRMLSEVRNYDVFLALVGRERSARHLVQRKQFELLHAILQKRRASRAENIRKRLKRIDVDKIANRLGIILGPVDGYASRTVAESEPEPATFGEELAQSSELALQVEQLASRERTPIDEAAVAARAADRLDQRLAEFQLLAAQSHPTNDPQELHQLRIAAKRLRYLIEIATDLGYGSATSALTYLRSLQDRIGEWHDLEALEEEIVGIVTRPRFVKQNLAESSSMLRAAAHLQNKKLRLVSQLFPVRVPKTVSATSERLARSLRRIHPTADPGPAKSAPVPGDQPVAAEE